MLRNGQGYPMKAVLHVIRRRIPSAASFSFLLLAGLLSAQESPIADASGPMPEVRLEAHQGKGSFRLGDRIELDLVFRNTTSDAYILNGSVYGDLADKVDVTPAQGWIRWQGQSGHDYASMAPLGATELRIPIMLNHAFVFREPGHYTIRVTTNRLMAGGDILHAKASGPITTNALGIDIAPLPPEAETDRVKSLLSQIDSGGALSSADAQARRNAILELAVLPGDDALRAKIRLILAEDDTMREVTREALASTRNLALQLSMLQAAWRDPAQPLAYDLPAALEETRALLRGETLPGFAMATVRTNSGQAEKAASDHRSDMEDLLRSLPARSGESRTDAAYYLMEDRNLSAEDVAKAKPIALEEFRNMDDTEQHMLLEAAWPGIRDAALLPELKAMLDRSAIDSDAISRLIELDPDGAKDYVIRAVCDSQSFVPLEAVSPLPDEVLPEVDSCLGKLLRVPPPRPTDHVWKTRAELAGRFASPAILPAVREGWTSPEQDSAVLPLLLRYAPAEAIAKIESEHQLNSISFFETNKVFESRRTGFPPLLTDWLRRQLADGPNDLAGIAAFELSQGGQPQDRLLLERRLTDLRSQSTLKSDGTASAAGNTPVSTVRKLEIELMSDLRGSQLWSVSDLDLQRLAAGCLSDECRQYGKSLQPDGKTAEN
jgi:hypothetical protein